MSDQSVVLLGEEAPIAELDELRPLIAEGQERGFLTFAQIAACLEEVEITKEQVLELHSYLEDQSDTPENNLLRAFQREQPAALQLARDLFETGILLNWRKTRAPVSEVVNGIAQRLELNA